MLKDINSFRVALLKAIQLYLIRKFSNNLKPEQLKSILVVFNANRTEVIYKLSKKKCKRLSGDINSSQSDSSIPTIDMTRQSEAFQSNILELLNCLEVSEYGYNLWEGVNNQLAKMPGSWRLFNSLRPLVLELTNLLKEYGKAELKKADDVAIKKFISELMERVKALLNRIKELALEVKTLKAEVRKLKGIINAKENLISRYEILDNEVQAVKAENANLVKSHHILREASSIYAKRVEYLEKENTQLVETLQEKIAALEKMTQDLNQDILNNTHTNQNPVVVQVAATETDPDSSIRRMREFNNYYSRIRSKTSSRSASSSIWKLKVESNADISSSITESTEEIGTSYRA